MWNASLPRPSTGHLPPTLASRIAKAEQVEAQRVSRRLAADIGVSNEQFRAAFEAKYIPTSTRITLAQERQDEIPDDALAFAAATRNQLATIQTARDIAAEPDDPATCLPLARIGPGGDYTREIHATDAADDEVSITQAIGEAVSILCAVVVSPFRWIVRKIRPNPSSK